MTLALVVIDHQYVVYIDEKNERAIDFNFDARYNIPARDQISDFYRTNHMLNKLVKIVCL
jgi:hypothetical protein